MEHSVAVEVIKKPVRVTITMSLDEAQVLYPFMGRLDLNEINKVMEWGVHKISTFGKPCVCTCGNEWPCRENDKYGPTNEAIFQLYAALDSALREADRV